MSQTSYDLLKAFEKINLLEIKKANLVKWVRDNIKNYKGESLGFVESIKITELVLEAHRLGMIRGSVVKN